MATAAGPTLPAQGMMTSDELDWLVYAYLEESGYHHTSFSLLTESNLAPPASSKPRGDSDTLPNGDRPTEHQPPPPPPTRNPVMDQVVPPGHLVRLLQKALLYLEAEARYRRDPTTAIPRIVGYPIPTTLPLPPLPKYVPPPAPAAPPAKEPSPAPAPPPASKPSETSKKGKGRAKATTAAVPPPAAAAAAPAEGSGPAEPPAPAPTKKAKKKALAGPTSATNESGSVRKPKLPASEGSSRPGSSAGGGAGANDARAGAVGFSSSKGKERAVEQSAPSTGAETAAAATDAAGDVRMHEASAEDPQVNGRRLSGSSSTTTKREKTKDKSAPTAGGGSAPPSTAPAAATSSKTGTGSKREREKDDLRPPPAKKAAASSSAAPGAASGTSSTARAAPDATKRSASPSIPRKSKSSGASESAPAPSSSTTGAPSSASLTSALASNSHTSNANSNSNPNKFRITTTTRTVSTPVSAMSSPSLAATASASSGLGGGGAGGGTQAPVSAAQLAADKRRRGSGEQAAASPSSGSGSGSGKDANAPASASDRLLQVKTEVADASAGGGGGKGDSRRDRSGASSLGTHALGGAMGKNGLGAVPRSPVKPPSPLKEFDMRGVREIRDDDARVVRLKGHTVSVSAARASSPLWAALTRNSILEQKVQPCAFNSKVPSLLATGGGDSTCRIWDVPPYSSASVDGAAAPAQTTVTDHIVCKHQSAQRRCDITCVAWDPSGSLLATGSEDGIVRIWTPSGDLHLVLSMHQRQVCSLKWNPRGTMLLTSSLDQTVCLWEVSNGKVRQQYATHADTVLDVDWNDDHTWASASMDKTVHRTSSSPLSSPAPTHPGPPDPQSCP